MLSLGQFGLKRPENTSNLTKGLSVFFCCEVPVAMVGCFTKNQVFPFQTLHQKTMNTFVQYQSFRLSALKMTKLWPTVTAY